jgi:NADPH2:quinone reductase
MKAIRVHETGGPEALRFEEVPDPVPAEGQVLVRLEAAGVNFIEIYQRMGLYKVKLPVTPGDEGAGTIEAVGPGVTGLAPGDRVASESFAGSYAELAVAPADRVVEVPAEVTTEQAAAVMVQGMTAHYLACTTVPLERGDRCLVHAAAGGVGLLLCRIARMRGARVIGTTSTAEKAALARAAGAEDVILYTEQDFEAEVKRITGSTGVRVVYDSVGRTTFEQSLRCLERRGTLVLFGQSSGPVPPFDPQALNRGGSLYLTRPKLKDHVVSRSELEQRAGDVLGWVRDGELEVRIDRMVPLAQAADAHRALESRQTAGKLLLVPARADVTEAT